MPTDNNNQSSLAPIEYFKPSEILRIFNDFLARSNASDKWMKRSGEYIFNSITPESELSDSLIIRPDKGTATFIRYMW